MTALRTSLVALLCCAPSISRADPISDPAAWTQQFIQGALKGDADGMSALVEGAAAPGLNVGAIKSGIQSAVNLTKTRQAESAEAFNEADVGTFLKRINVAVLFQKSSLFYSFTFGRHGEGWMIYNFKVDGNVNDILNAPWPE